MPDYKTVAKVGEIPEGHGRAFEVAGRLVAVFLDGGKYYAIDDCCPHQGTSLATGHLANGIVTCPDHGWRFSIRDGAWCDYRSNRLDCFDVRVQGDEIQVRVTTAE